jgi:hypothetical protein
VQIFERINVLIEVCRALCDAVGVDPDILWNESDSVSRPDWRWAGPHLPELLGGDPRVLALEGLRRATDMQEPKEIGTAGSRAVMLVFVFNALCESLKVSTADLWDQPVG